MLLKRASESPVLFFPTSLRKIRKNQLKDDLMHQNLKCLYVEDDPDTRETMASILEIEDIRTKTCSNPEEAKILLEKEKFDFVISDLTFPGFSFKDVKKLVKSIVEKGISVVICSAAEWKDEKPKGIVLLEKPITCDEFERALKEVTEKVGQAVPKEEFKLLKPDRHVKTPLMKALEDVSQNSTKAEREELGSCLETMELQRNLSNAAGSILTKREIDEMLCRYIKLVKKANPSKTRKKPVKRTVQME